MAGNWIGLKTLIRREIFRFFVVFTQTLIPPLVSSTLFIFVFGYSLGRNLNFSVNGIGYLEFMIPGLVAMHLVEGSYANTSSSLFISRWHNMIQELLLSPLSYFEMVLGLLAGGVTRGIVVSCGVYAVSNFFTHFAWSHFWITAYFFVLIPFIFACLGLIVGLWATDFEKLSIWGTFVLTPLVYFGGVFHRADMVPGPLQFISRVNPVFYLVSGLRYGMLGFSDVDIRICMAVAAFMAIALFMVVERLFRIGFHLRS